MTSYFSKIPPELRLCIYEYVFWDNTPDEIELFAAFKNQPETALLRTCSGIYIEARPMHTAAATLYRESKTWTVLLDHSLKSSSDAIAVLMRYARSSFPAFVRSLQFTWLNSTASLHFKIDDEAGFHVFTKYGDCGGGYWNLALQRRGVDLEAEESKELYVQSTEGKEILHTRSALFCLLYGCLDMDDEAGRKKLGAAYTSLCESMNEQAKEK